ncbi:MAG TPA: hypothetical protein DCM38_09590 [Gammaproteobacteria bacterium]|nr:hypothetical protein [Gammaproteobacteria bacterium]
MKSYHALYFLIQLLLWCHTAQGNPLALIAEVDRGIVPQTAVRGGWLPIRLVFAYQGLNYTVRLQVNSEVFNRYSQEMARRPRPDDLLSRLQLAEQGTSDLASLISSLKLAAPNQGPETLAAFALTFVQSLPYKLDALTTPFDDAWRTPLQTLVDQEIDCEDSSILYSSLLSGLGINNGLILVPGHILTGVEGPFSGDFLGHAGQKYYLAETTGLGWMIGKSPPEYQDAMAQFLPISAIKQPFITPAIQPLSANEPLPSSVKSPSSGPMPIGLLLIVGLILIGILAWIGLNDHHWLSQPSAQHRDKEILEEDPYKDYD